MPQLQLSDGRIHYAESGRGEPLLLLHANPGDARDYDAVRPALAERYRVLALDWPGYGGSRPPASPERADLPLIYRVLREFVAALQLPPAIVVGNSVGGYAAARLAAESPQAVRALVLVAPGGFTAHNAFTRAFCRLQGSRGAIPPRRLAALYLKRRTATVEAMLARAAGEQSDPQRRALNRALWRSFLSPEGDLRGLATQIRAPTLLIFGRRDPVISARRDGAVAARCLPAARRLTLDCGHAPFAEMPEQFLAAVLQFLASVEASP
jgi:pimeloyl-ACP methyl ester carboxylesterase